MSAFLMSEDSLSDLAYNVFMRGSGNMEMSKYFKSEDVTCPEDLFKKLRWENIKSINARYDDGLTEKDIGEYHFRKNELTLPQLIKKIQCWLYQSCESDEVCEGKLYKALAVFAGHCALKYMNQVKEYQDADWD